MTLKSIFQKPVDRPIEGVIKADDEANLRLELEEYVLTNEVESRLEKFLDAYNTYEGANGVWISGFFGSGKSHLLKILALLLENREIDGVPTLDLFLPKCRDNEILRGDLKRAIAIPSKSILFNIDQKADVISKTEIDALLAVFVKVFDEMCGYYGKQGHIAKFERDLDSRGLYEEFKTAYKSLSNLSWKKGREQALLESESISKAYAQVIRSNETSSTGILDKYRSEYHVSIEDFAIQVKAYLDQQSPDFRLNFFVDEVGQYIADNVKLMTNLQTIAESLATKCLGRAWIIVTSQNDMTTVLGEMTQQQSNDFSKIKARFDTKMLLTSKDVAEVIQKRLLAKTDDGAERVSDLYHEEHNNFGTLFSFTDGSRTYLHYKDREEFIRTYPFVPYQFDLFQLAIENLSRHNAFEGKHSSVGERSMLGVFQQVAVQISDYEIGQLASFDLMFEGIHTVLKSQTQKAILAAERQLGNGFAVKLLKALFLVKYVKEFKPTLHNMCVLMLDGFHQDIPKLRMKVEEALNLLEQQTYIQRNGEVYEYLTDEEKDVEQEIKNTDVETTDVSAELETIIFDHVIKSRKIRYDENSQDYPYSRKLDDHLHGREYELTIHVITPFNDNAGNESILQMQSMGRDELLVLMPTDDRLIRDILMYKRTEKYIRQNISSTQREEVRGILEGKALQNRERYAELKQRVRSLLEKAKLLVAGHDIEITNGDPQTRIIRGFHDLITRTYPNLRMLRGITYNENDISKYLSQSQNVLFEVDQKALPESEQEVLAYIRNPRSNVRTTLKNLLEKFEHKPYGWYYAAILCTLAKLCAKGKVEVRTDSNILENDDLERELRNTRDQGNVVLEQIDINEADVRKLRDFYSEFFDSPPPASEAKAIGNETGIALQEMLNKLMPIEAQIFQYPFLKTLTPIIEILKELCTKSYTWYLSELVQQKEVLLDMKETSIDPLLKFMHGPRKGIYDNARELVQEQESNFIYIEGNASADILEILNDQECFKGNTMQQLKSMVDNIQKKVLTQIDIEIANAKDRIETLKKLLCGENDFLQLPKEQQEEILKRFDDFISLIEQQTLIAVIRDRTRQFEEEDYQRVLVEMTTQALPEQDDSEIKNPQPEYIHSRSIQVPFDKAWIADESDVDRYLESLRKALLEEIRNGKRIQI